jgi:predicted permease
MFSAVVGSFGIERMDLSPDATVFAYALAASLLSALAFGLLPALHAARLEVTAALRGESPLVRRRGHGMRTRHAMVGVQVAGSAMLLVVAGLLLHSSRVAQSVDPGFDTTNLYTVSVDVARQGYTPDHAATLYEELRAMVSAMAGVRNVAFTRYAPLAVGNMMGFTADDPHGGDGAYSNVRVNVVSPEYFATLGVPLRAGRSATSNEVRASSEHLAVVSANMARLFWPGANPIGQRFHSGQMHWIVTGVAADVRNGSLDAVDHAFVYEAAKPDPTGLQLIVRTSGPSNSIVSDVPRLVHALDPHLVVQVLPYETQMARVLRPARTAARLTALMAGLAALLAIVGVYGVVSFNVSQRMREFGVRLALGAPRRAIVTLVLHGGMITVAAGLCVGLAMAMGAAMLLRGFLVGIDALDPLAFAGMSALLLIAAVVAMAGPAVRAVRVDPASSLRGV